MMQSAIETRELVTLDGNGVSIQGTYHRASARRDASDDSPRPLGVLFLNALSAPRASFGDAAVKWAEAFAHAGYPSFRFDLPGLGDTEGEAPSELIHFINDGGYASVATSKLKELVERFQLSGVVIVGHCAGAVTALYAASQGKECKGLILMDPYFYLVRGISPKLRLSLVDLASRNRIAGRLRSFYDRVRGLRQAMGKSRPPRNANFALLARWKQVASAGLPILILKAPGLEAPGTTLKPGQFAYLKHLLTLAGRRGRVDIKLVENTDHSFANNAGRVAVQQHVEAWLSHHFPPVEGLTSLTHASRSEAYHEESSLLIQT